MLLLDLIFLKHVDVCRVSIGIKFYGKIPNVFVWVNEDRNLLGLMVLLISYVFSCATTGSHIRNHRRVTEFISKTLNYRKY